MYKLSIHVYLFFYIKIIHILRMFLMYFYMGKFCVFEPKNNHGLNHETPLMSSLPTSVEISGSRLGTPLGGGHHDNALSISYGC